MQIIALQGQPIKVDGITLEKELDGTLKISQDYKAFYNSNKVVKNGNYS
jgi:hypothetical protein